MKVKKEMSTLDLLHKDAAEFLPSVSVDCVIFGFHAGELKVLLVNHGDVPFTVARGDRVAQLVLCPVALADLGRVDALDATPRGQGGYGSTGV